MRSFLIGMVVLLGVSCSPADEKNAKEAFEKAVSYAAKREHDKAVEAFSEAILANPKALPIYDRRGDSYLKLGKFTEAIADFDKFLEGNPKFEPEHWRRGIAYYYAGKHAEGVKQFQTHKLVNPQDVENAVWHYLCNSKVIGKEKAAKELIDVTTDRRVPMAEIQKLYAGKLRPDEFEKMLIFKFDENKPEAKPDPRFDTKTEAGKEALFYGHLYVALWYESEGKDKKVVELLTPAVDKYVITHYMWDVAKVHLEWTKKKLDDAKLKKGR
jgi:lipoprotein NlpI